MGGRVIPGAQTLKLAHNDLFEGVTSKFREIRFQEQKVPGQK